MKKLILIFILYLFSFNASSQEWVNSLREYHKAKDFEGGIRLLERQQKTPYVYRHFTNLYSLQLEFMSGSDKLTKEGDILKSKFITSILKGAKGGDVCNKKRIFDQSWQRADFGILYTPNEYKFVNTLKNIFPEINTFKYNNALIDILRSYESIFFNDLTNNKKYRKQVLKDYFHWNEGVCEYVPKLKKLGCETMTQKFTAEAAKYGNFQALNTLFNEALDIHSNKINYGNPYNEMSAEEILIKIVNNKQGWARAAANLSMAYIEGNFGIMKNYIKAHAYGLVAQKNTRDDGPFSGEWGKKRLAKLNAIKLPIESEIEAQKLAEKIMLKKKNQPKTQYEYPLKDICQHDDNFIIVTPFKKE